MADDANHLAAGVQCVQRTQRHFERVAIERAKAFVEEQRINRGFAAHQVRQRQRQRQADQERLPARERARVACHVALPTVHNVQLQLARGFAAQQVAPVQARQVPVGQVQQVFQRQPLGEAAEFVALGRTNQRIQPLPEIAVLRLRGDGGQQCGLLAAALGVVVQACLGCAQACAVRVAHFFQGV